MTGPYRPDPQPPCAECAKRFQRERQAATGRTWVPRAAIALLCVFVMCCYGYLAAEGCQGRLPPQREDACRVACLSQGHAYRENVDDRCFCDPPFGRVVEVTP